MPITKGRKKKGTKQISSIERKRLVHLAIVQYDLWRPSHIMRFIAQHTPKGIVTPKHETIKADVDEIKAESNTKFNDIAQFGGKYKIGKSLTDGYQHLAKLDKILENLMLGLKPSPSKSLIKLLAYANGKPEYEDAVKEIEDLLTYKITKPAAGTIAWTIEQRDKHEQHYFDSIAAYPLFHAVSSKLDAGSAENTENTEASEGLDDVTISE